MLVGEPPYTGSTPQAILGKIIQGQPTWATQARRTVPLNVDAAIRTALEKIPADRFTTAGGFAVALRDPGFRHRQSIVGGRAGARRSPWQAALLVGLGVTVGLFAPVAWLLARPGASTPAEVMRFALPTSGSAALETGTVAQDLTISPDGKLIAYTGATVDGSDLQIHVWSVGQLSGERLRGAEGGFSPFFSPDGQWIGFVDTADGTTLKRVPTTGGRTETIATLPDSVSYVAGAAWGADDIIVGTGQAGGLYRVSLDGVAPVRLTKGQHHWPALVEGRDAVLLMDHANGQHLAALDLRTGEVKPLGVEGTSPRYVSTGHLVYASPDGALWGVPFDPASLEVRGSPVLLAEGVDVKAATESAANFAVSATGHLIYAAGRTATNLVMVARDGARSVLLEQNGWSAYPRFSPDGSRLVYDLSSGDGTGAVDLWVLDVARGARTRVTLDGDNRFYPVWTPDGVRLTHATTSGPRAAIVSTSADGSGAADTLLPSGRGGYPTSWAPNGRTLAYDVPSERTATGSGDIALLHVDGGGNRTEPFLETAFHEAGAIFSPNGRWIVYVSDKSGQADIYVRPFPGPGGEVTISVGGGEEPRWSRAGDEIYFRRGADLLAVSVGERGSALEVGTPRHVMTDPYRREGGAMANYDVQPGGEGVVVVENANSSDAPTDRLYLVLNWFTELRVRSPR
jgi:serine/threonine-protein kinase